MSEAPPLSTEASTLGRMREVPPDLAAKLANAANELLTSFDSVQMNDIAAAAGVARSSLYYYFANKDDVLTFMLGLVLDELATATSAAAAGPGNPATRLRAVIRAQLEHLNQHPNTSQLLISNLGRAGKLPDIAARVHDGFEEPVRQLLAEGAADGSLRALSDDALGATALFGAVLVIGLRYLVTAGRIDVDGVIERIGEMFWYGIAPLASETGAPRGL
jgi:AcrR family transcriptional regulator